MNTKIAFAVAALISFSVFAPSNAGGGSCEFVNNIARSIYASSADTGTNIKTECLASISAFNASNSEMPSRDLASGLASIKSGCFTNIFALVQDALRALVKQLNVPGAEDFANGGILPDGLTDIYPLVCIRQQQLDFYALMTANLFEIQKLYDGIVNKKP